MRVAKRMQLSSVERVTAYTQCSILRSGTRENSLTLFVTRTAPRDSTCAAISWQAGTLRIYDTRPQRTRTACSNRLKMNPSTATPIVAMMSMMASN